MVSVNGAIVGAERAEHLVGGDVVEAERRARGASGSGELVLARGLQQGEGADDVGLHERRRAVDRAVDVAFGRQMHHRVRLVGGEDLAHRRGVGDVGADQHVAVVVRAPPPAPPPRRRRSSCRR